MSHGGSPLRVGTRGSALAVWQAERIRARLAERGYVTERVEIRTTGDLAPDVPLGRAGARALFTKQLDDAILEGRIDLAVHSLKDLPTRLPDGLAIAAVGLREDPRDALVSRRGLRWGDLPPGSLVATSSVRRRAQLLRVRRDLRMVDIRGNVDTRLAKLEANPEWGAVVLAVAGLVRLGRADRIAERLSFDLMLPAPGQGALAVTVREDDRRAMDAVRGAVHEPDTELATAAERGLLRALEGGCQVPVGAYAEIVDPADRLLRLRGRVVSPGGEASVDGERVAPAETPAAAEALGAALARELLSLGGGDILRSARHLSPPVAEP